MPLTPLPPTLARLSTPTGYHRRGIKAIVFGEAGAGKSYFLASMPRPLVAFDCGAESGIQQYLRAQQPDAEGNLVHDPERFARGEEDLCFLIQNPDDMKIAIDYCLANQEIVKSVAIDGFTHAWADHMDYWQDKLGREFNKGDWKKIKGPWRQNLKALMWSQIHVMFSAHLRDLEFEQGPGAGVKPIETAAVEKNVPYVVDLSVQMRIKRDEKNRPTPVHVAQIAKCRRPACISPADLHAGKKWMFDERKPENPWEKIIDPIYQKWDNDKAMTYEGFEPHELRDVKEAQGALLRAADDGEAGRMCRLMLAENFQNLQQLKSFWDLEIGPNIDGMSPASRKAVIQVKDQLKSALEKK